MKIWCFLLFLYYCKLNIFGFWIIGQDNFVLWDIVMTIFHWYFIRQTFSPLSSHHSLALSVSPYCISLCLTPSLSLSLHISLCLSLWVQMGSLQVNWNSWSCIISILLRALIGSAPLLVPVPLFPLLPLSVLGVVCVCEWDVHSQESHITQSLHYGSIELTFLIISLSCSLVVCNI